MRFCLVLAIVIFVSGQILACPKYNRKDYRHWIDEDRDCQNTRNEVLIQESLDPVSFKSSKGCKVLSGRWFGSFTCKTFNNPKQLAIDAPRRNSSKRSDSLAILSEPFCRKPVACPGSFSSVA